MTKFLPLICTLCALLFSAMLTRGLILHETGAYIASFVFLVAAVQAAKADDRAKQMKARFNATWGAWRGMLREAAILNALRFYANGGNYKMRPAGDSDDFTTAVHDDNGGRARNTLATLHRWPTA